jgi:small subunit ribosomal protein S16
MMPLTFQVVKRVHLSPLALNEKLKSDVPAKYGAVSAGRGPKKSNLGFFAAVAGQLALKFDAFMAIVIVPRQSRGIKFVIQLAKFEFHLSILRSPGFQITAMPIRLRLAMHGTRHRKIFHLVAINHSLRRDAKPAELLGIYNPHDRDIDNTRLVRWSVTRIHHWLSMGARPSKSVVKLLELVST